MINPYSQYGANMRTDMNINPSPYSPYGKAVTPLRLPQITPQLIFYFIKSKFGLYEGPTNGTCLRFRE